MSPFKSTKPPKFNIDLGRNKYPSRFAELLQILFYSKELPSDLYTQMNITYDNFRKKISLLSQKQLIKKISKDRTVGYQLTLKGKKLTRQLNYMKYRDQLDDADDRHQNIQRRYRKHQFAYLYALFDRMGIIYETDKKPALSEATVSDSNVYFFTALDLKRMVGIEATAFKGSRLLGFLIGKGKIIPVYRTNQMLRTFGSHESLVPLLMNRCFTATVNTAILVCNDEDAVSDIINQIIENSSNDPKSGINTAQYKYFYVLPSDDTFYSHLEDLYVDHTETEQQIIERYGIDTSTTDPYGRYKYVVGTGYIDRHPVWICSGNVNAVTLKLFIRNAEIRETESYIFCKERDGKMLRAVTRDTPVKIIQIK